MAQAKSNKIEFAAGLTEKDPGRTFTATQIADHLGMDAKTFRGKLRKMTTERAEKGGRWEISEFAAEKLVARIQKGQSTTKFTFKPELLDEI